MFILSKENNGICPLSQLWQRLVDYSSGTHLSDLKAIILSVEIGNKQQISSRKFVRKYNYQNICILVFTKVYYVWLVTCVQLQK